MNQVLTATLEARNPDRNHHRRYAISVGHDLFGAWTLTIWHGRIGQAGQATRFAASELIPLKAILRERLKRRLSAPRRIGCEYRLVELSCATGLRPIDWLPEEFMSVRPQGQVTGCSLDNLPCQS